MILVLIGQVGEVDTHRDALNDFDVVAGRVFGREERENGTVAPPICVILPWYLRPVEST